MNSGLIIAYAADLYRLVTLRPIKNNGNDQLHFQYIYTDDTLRQKLNIKLDHRSEMFQSLFQALDDVELRFQGISYESSGNVLLNFVFRSTSLCAECGLRHVPFDYSCKWSYQTVY